MIDHLSASQLAMFLRCPRQYYFRYIRGLKRPPGGRLIQGKAIHEALAHNYGQKVESHEDLEPGDVVDFMAATFHEHSKGEVEWEQDDPGELLDQGVSLTDTYQRQWAPSVQPAAVELEQRVSFGEACQVPDLLGYIDLVDEAGTVVDHKVVARGKSQGDADNDLQLSCYALMRSISTGEVEHTLAFDCLVKTKTPKVVRVSTRRTQRDLAFLLGQITEVYRSIMAGIFPPNTGGWHCDPRFCGYYNECKG